MNPDALCPRCCNRASEMCAGSCDQGPVVECSRHGIPDSTPAAMVLERAHTGLVIIGEDVGGWSPPATPRAPLPEFAVSAPGEEVERARAEVDWLRTAARELVNEWLRKASALGRWESSATTAMRYGFTACARDLQTLIDQR